MRLIDADEVLKRWGLKFYAMGGDRLGPNGDEISFYVNGLLNEIQNAPTVLHDNYSMGYQDGVKKVLSERQGEWILINERLPDYMEDILITFQIPNREPLVYRAVFIGGKFNFDNGDTWNWNDPEIKAWMPLPEAYKEAENEQ